MVRNGGAVTKVRLTAVAAGALSLALLVLLALTVGLRVPGFVAGGTYAAGLALGVARARRVDGTPGLGPADRVTLTRAVLVGGVTGLVADSLGGPVSVPVLVALAAVALALDAVDGAVARRTGSSSAFGARFDMEIDAFLILVLCVAAVPQYGGWVLGLGIARYAFWFGGRLWPWMTATLPYRFWRKVVAATQGVVLTVVVSGLLPHAVGLAVLGVSAALLAESFGRDVLWSWRHRPAEPAPAGHPDRTRRTLRRVCSASLSVLAAAVLVLALTAPQNPGQLTAGAFLRIPVEGLVLVVLILSVPPRWGRVLAVVAGGLLAVLVLIKALDVGFGIALDRPFDPISDWAYLRPALGVLSDSIGHAGAVAVAVLAGLLVVALAALVPLSAHRVAVVAGRHRVATARVVGGLGVVWVLCAAVGLQLVPGAPVASASTGGLAYAQVGAIRADIADQHAFVASIDRDPVAVTPTDDLLTALRGKDVLFVFVESYGRVALTDPLIAPGVDEVLATGTKQLAADGFSARSGYLVSPTFGGISWLAHSTLQSGLWIDSQLRYNELVASDRFTLSDAFARAGWRTVGDVPSNYVSWPEGTSFYHYQAIYDAHNVGYAGPQFGYAQMPDQYVLAAFQRAELSAPHPPVMAEIDLVSSHTPWAPLPTMVDWNSVGDGSVFDGMPAAGATAAAVWSSDDGIKRAYGQSIEYSLTALTSFVGRVDDPNLVMVVLGDHQPAAVVSGSNTTHDVPISIVARDPAVLSRLAGWGWTDGLRPADDAPVWPMDAFRDRFLAAFGR
jgi:phosphatidylglycerophosphate synthase